MWIFRYAKHIFLRFSSNSEVSTTELLENHFLSYILIIILAQRDYTVSIIMRVEKSQCFMFSGMRK